MSDVEREKRALLTNSLLAALVAALVVTILAGLLAIIWYASILGDSPRTEAERRIAVYEVAVVEQPDAYESWTGLILAYVDVGRYADAESVFTQYSDESSETAHPAVMIAHADIAFVRDRFEESLKRYEAARVVALELDEKSREENQARGISFEKASAAVVSATIGMARSHANLDAYTEALDYYDLALELSPLAADILVERARVHIALGESADARADLERAIELDPFLEDARSVLAELDS